MIHYPAFLSHCSLAEEKKNSGNDLYKIKRYDAALQLYTDAINLCPETPAYYGNRAATYMMLGDYKAALRDAKQSVQIDAFFEKGYMRIAKCSLLMGKNRSKLSEAFRASKIGA